MAEAGLAASKATTDGEVQRSASRDARIKAAEKQYLSKGPIGSLGSEPGACLALSCIRDSGSATGDETADEIVDAEDWFDVFLGRDEDYENPVSVKFASGNVGGPASSSSAGESDPHVNPEELLADEMSLDLDALVRLLNKAGVRQVESEILDLMFPEHKTRNFLVGPSRFLLTRGLV